MTAKLLESPEWPAKIRAIISPIIMQKLVTMFGTANFVNVLNRVRMEGGSTSGCKKSSFSEAAVFLESPLSLDFERRTSSYSYLFIECLS